MKASSNQIYSDQEFGTSSISKPGAVSSRDVEGAAQAHTTTRTRRHSPPEPPWHPGSLLSGGRRSFLMASSGAAGEGEGGLRSTCPGPPPSELRHPRRRWRSRARSPRAAPRQARVGAQGGIVTIQSCIPQTFIERLIRDVTAAQEPSTKDGVGQQESEKTFHDSHQKE